MSKKRSRRMGPEGHRASGPRAPGAWLALFPALAAAALSVPCLGLGYFWDDFYFLTSRGIGAHLLPDPHATFYRPLPLGLYFKALYFLDAAGGTVGHLLNLAALIVTVVLLTLLVSRLCGRRAGLFAGFVFAGYGQVPTLVAWISASQDLFAILFVAAALLLRHRGRDVAALACATAALLCKETALAAFPLLVLWDHLVGRPARRVGLRLAGYSLIVVLWALIHPGIHQLIAGRATAIGYVGVQQSGRWALNLGRYVMALCNLPPWGLTALWPRDRAGYGLAAVAIMVVGVWYAERRRRSETVEHAPLARAGLAAAFLAAPSLLLPAILVRYAAPHLTCMAAFGAAIFLGPALARQGRLVATIALAAFVLLGIRSRGTLPDGDWIATESAMIEASQATREVRANFRTLLPTLPAGSQVVISMGARGRGIQMALVDGQALSLWYRDPALRTVMIRERAAGAPSEILVRVTNRLDVIAIDPDRLDARSALGVEPDLSEIDPPVSNYARAVAAAGDVDRAVRIMEGLNRIEPADLIVYNRRLIASMLLSVGRRGEADSVLAATATMPREVALPLVAQLQADASPSARLDAAAFEAFGLTKGDPETIRWIVRDLEKRGSTAQAAWFALQLERLAPRDPEAAEVLRRAARTGVRPERMPGRLGPLGL